VITYFGLIIGICVFFERNTASCFRCCVFCQNDDGNLNHKSEQKSLESFKSKEKLVPWKVLPKRKGPPWSQVESWTEEEVATG